MAARQCIDHVLQAKESGSFCEQKEPKKLRFLWATGVGNARLQTNKSFLRRFFSKKRLLTFTFQTLRGTDG
jgi:hypothetical protein